MQKSEEDILTTFEKEEGQKDEEIIGTNENKTKKKKMKMEE